MKKRRARIQPIVQKVDMSEFEKLLNEAAPKDDTASLWVEEDVDYSFDEVEDDRRSVDVEDYESIIMNALANGAADKYGF